MLGEGYVPTRKVVLLSGTVEYFSNDHLPYAIPALLVVLLIVLLPLLFMLYPNGIQVISGICGEREIMPDDYSIYLVTMLLLLYLCMVSQSFYIPFLDYLLMYSTWHRKIKTDTV